MNSQQSIGEIASVVINLRSGTAISYYPKRDMVAVQKTTADGYKMIDVEIPVEEFIQLCANLIASKTREKEHV